MKELGYATDGSDTSMPATIGTMVARAVTDHRHKDGSNQLGGYADTTGYQPVNTPDQAIDRWRWQPLRVPLGTGNPPRALTPQWPTFSAAAAEAGQSRRYGGIHFPSGDLHGRSLGDAVGWDAWTRAQSYIRPFSPGPI